MRLSLPAAILIVLAVLLVLGVKFALLAALVLAILSTLER